VHVRRVDCENHADVNADTGESDPHPVFEEDEMEEIRDGILYVVRSTGKKLLEITE